MFPLVRNPVVDQDGDVRCPKCGARNAFSVKRSGKGKLMGAMLAPKRLQCQGCGAYLKQTAMTRHRAGATGKLSDPPPSLGGVDGTHRVVLTAPGPSVTETSKVLRDELGLTLKVAKIDR